MYMDSDDAFADEIVEIFVEEVGEVLEQIDKHYPAWFADARDNAALKEVRRAFHTLKGSGRMVQADEIGELAWAVENLLNRVLDGTLRVNEAVYELVEEVRRVTPTLLKAFENKQAAALAGVNVNRLIEQADAIREGKAVSSLREYASPEDVAEPPQVFSGGDSVHSEDLDVINDRIGEIMTTLDEHRRHWVNLDSQVDALKTQLNMLPKTMDADDIRTKLDNADREIKELKYFVKSSSSELLGNVNEAQKRLSTRVDQELKILNDVSAQIRADLAAENQVLRAALNNRMKMWSVGSALLCSAAVLVIAVFLL